MNGNAAPDLATPAPGPATSATPRCGLSSSALPSISTNTSPVPSPATGPLRWSLAGPSTTRSRSTTATSTRRARRCPWTASAPAFRDRFDAELDKEVPIRFDDKADSGAVIDQGIAPHHRVPRAGRHARSRGGGAAVLRGSGRSGQQRGTRPFRLVGAFDLVVRERDRPIVVEHKTAARKYTREQARLGHTAVRLLLCRAGDGHGAGGASGTRSWSRRGRPLWRSATSSAPTRTSPRCWRW